MKSKLRLFKKKKVFKNQKLDSGLRTEKLRLECQIINCRFEILFYYHVKFDVVWRIQDIYIYFEIKKRVEHVKH